MKQASFSIVILCLFTSAWPKLGSTQILPKGFVAVPAFSGEAFDLPTGMSFAPDGSLFVIEKRGRVYIVQDSVRQEPPFLNIEQEVHNVGELGLLGIAIDPNFEGNGFVYLCYSVDTNNDGVDEQEESTFGRLTRYSVDSENPNVADHASRNVLIGDEWSTGVPLCHLSHAGGALRFGSDGTLLLSTGDGASFLDTDIGGATPDCFQEGRIDSSEDIGRFRAQNIQSLSGKILRIDPETGRGLPSNPYFSGAAADNQSKVWAYGLRNPFRFGVRDNGSTDPKAGRPGSIYIGDVGDAVFEDLHISKAGGENLGWPCYEGLAETTLADSSRCTNIGSISNPAPHSPPVMHFHHSDATQSYPVPVTGRVIIAGCFYTASQYPTQFQNGFFFGDYINGWVRVLRVDEEDNVVEVLDFTQLSSYSVVDFRADPISGDIHFLHLNEGMVYRISYSGTVPVVSPPEQPGSFQLIQNYPNPFNPTTTIHYQLSATSKVELSVFNSLGQRVRTLVSERKPAGVYQIQWHGRNYSGDEVPSGVYLYRLTVGSYEEVKKMLLLR